MRSLRVVLAYTSMLLVALGACGEVASVDPPTAVDAGADPDAGGADAIPPLKVEGSYDIRFTAVTPTFGPGGPRISRHLRSAWPRASISAGTGVGTRPPSRRAGASPRR